MADSGRLLPISLHTPPDLWFATNMSQYNLTDFEWRVIKPLLPNKPRGVRGVDDRRVLNGIFWVLRSGAPWRDLPERYGPHTTCCNRFVRWRKAGAWGRLMDAISAARDNTIQMIDSTSIRVHQQAATAKSGVQIIVSADHAAASRPRFTSLSTRKASHSARPNSRTGARADRQHAARPPWPRHHRAGRQGL